MRFALKNIGIVEDASVEIDGVTVIAGKNNTGKSTVTRAAFSVLNAFQDVLPKTHEVRELLVKEKLKLLFESASEVSAIFKVPVICDLQNYYVCQDVATKLFDNLEEVKLLSEEGLNRKLAELTQNSSIGDWNAEKASQSSVLKEILDILNTPDKDLFKDVLEYELRAEFANQICNVFLDNADAGIEVEDHGHSMRIGLAGDRVAEFNSDNFSFDSQVLYFEDPSAFDRLGRDSSFGMDASFFSDSRTMSVANKVYHARFKNNVLEDTEDCQKLQRVLQKISTVCQGDMVVKDLLSEFSYYEPSKDKLLNFSNLSASLKSLAVLKILLKRGVIKSQDLLIWDEPESHLHPELQILLAEVLVLLQKDFGLRILLTTNSPYFLRAVQIFACKYDIDGVCKYYRTISNGGTATIEDLGADLEEVYADFVDPFQRLENLNWQL